MVPDFEYFMRMRVKSIYSHSFIGLLWFDLPLTIILAFIFHYVVRNTLINNLPGFLAARLIAFTDFDWNAYFKRKYIIVIVSALLGASSHIAWDSFTHEDGFAVERISDLSNSIQLFGTGIPLFKLLQHGSSAVGAIAICITIVSLPALPFKRRSGIWKHWLLTAFVAVIIVGVNIALGLNPKFYGHVVVTAITGILTGLTTASLVLKHQNRLQ